MLMGDKWRFYDNNGGLDTGVTLDTSWHHHCIVYDGNFLTYYNDSDRVVIASKSLNTASGPLVLEDVLEVIVLLMGRLMNLHYSIGH